MRRAIVWVVALTLLLVFCILSGLALREWTKKLEAGEHPAISALRTIALGEQIHQARKGRFASLAELREAELVDAVLASGTKQGYVFEVRVATTRSAWSALARPVELGKLPRRVFIQHAGGAIYSHFVSKPEELAAVALDAETAAVPSGWTSLGQ